MSFDALTIGGLALALLAAGLLIGIVRGNDKASEVRRHPAIPRPCPEPRRELLRKRFWVAGED